MGLSRKTLFAEDITRPAVYIMDTLRLSVNEKANCVLRFRTAAIYEFMFWDAAYRFEKWKY